MSSVTLLDGKPVKHLEVSPSAWFFMNRLRGRADSAAHDHNFLEIAFILKGDVRHLVIQGEERCRTGDIYVIPIGAWHGYRGAGELEICNCLLSPALLERELAWMKTDPVFGPLFGLGEPRGLARIRRLRWPPSRRPVLIAHLEALQAAYEEGQPRTAVIGRLFLLFALLHDAARGCLARTPARDETHPRVRQGLELLHHSLSESWTLGKLAARLRLNPSYAVRLFRAQTGLSPMKLLQRIRAEKAATLLLSSHQRVGEVGLEVGWPDPRHFARNFAGYFGMSASQYRRRMGRRPAAAPARKRSKAPLA